MALPQTPHAPALSRYLSLALALLLAFGIASTHLARDSLWFDEGYSLYIVRDAERLSSKSPVTVVRHIFNSLRDTVARTRADVHPPLYFVLLDGWTLVAGDSVNAVRLLSTFLGLIGLAATYALGKRLFNHQTGVVALLVLATAGMFIYYSRETRMYTLLLTLAVLATLAYSRWRERPTRWRTLVYGCLLAALMYTQYVGAFIVVTHGLHLLLTQPRHSGRIVTPAVIALLLYVPWIPALHWQLTTHGGAAAIPFGDLNVALAALIFFLTGGYWGLYLLPLVLAVSKITPSPPAPFPRQQGKGEISHRKSKKAPPRWREGVWGGVPVQNVPAPGSVSHILLLLLWLIVTPLALLLLNGTIQALFQVRYAIGMLPAGALLVAYGITAFTIKKRARRAVAPTQSLYIVEGQRIVPLLPHRLRKIGAFIFLGLLLYTQLTVYPFVWNAKPDWQGAIERMVAARQPLEPAITLIPETIPAAYYARQYPVRQGIALDLAWRWQESYAMANTVAHMGSAEAVWLVMPSTFVSTWDAARELLATRTVGYRDSVMNLILYRFDAEAGSDLQFTFANRLGYRGGIRNQLFAIPGADFCFTVTLDVLVDFDHDYAADFYLTQGYGTIRAITTQPIDRPTAGEVLTFDTCLPIAPDNPPGPHHLRLRVYHPTSNQALPLLEQGTVYWSDELVFALVSVG